MFALPIKLTLMVPCVTIMVTHFFFFFLILYVIMPSTLRFSHLSLGTNFITVYNTLTQEPEVCKLPYLTDVTYMADYFNPNHDLFF